MSDRPYPPLCSSANAKDSGSSPPLPPEVDADPFTEEGVPHADFRLEAREYETTTFNQTLLRIIQTLRVPTWAEFAPETDRVKISKVSGALTNAVFSISCVGVTPSRSPPLVTPCAGSSVSQTITPRIVLLRIYGPSASKLIARSDELHILHTLSSIHRIGPRVFGTFRNGRIEEWFDSTVLTAKDIRDPVQSRWIGRRIRDLHDVDICGIIGSTWDGQELVLKNILSWKGEAQEVLTMLKTKEDNGEIGPDHPWSRAKEKLDLALFMRAWEAYWTWLQKQEVEYGRSGMVLAHNDLREGNLLRTHELTPGASEHHQIIVIDFDYAGPNPAAFDIANHFNEWTNNYDSPDASRVITSSRYPTREERWNFYLGYLSPAVLEAQPVMLPASQTSIDSSAPSGMSHGSFASNSNPMELGSEDIDQASSILDAQVIAWSPASHAYCVIWGIVQAYQDVTAGVVGEFDHLMYATSQLEKFQEDLKQRGIRWRGSA